VSPLSLPKSKLRELTPKNLLGRSLTIKMEAIHPGETSGNVYRLYGGMSLKMILMATAVRT
jgi:hypothetical protein